MQLTKSQRETQGEAQSDHERPVPLRFILLTALLFLHSLMSHALFSTTQPIVD